MSAHLSKQVRVIYTYICHKALWVGTAGNRRCTHTICEFTETHRHIFTDVLGSTFIFSQTGSTHTQTQWLEWCYKTAKRAPTHKHSDFGTQIHYHNFFRRPQRTTPFRLTTKVSCRVWIYRSSLSDYYTIDSTLWWSSNEGSKHAD